MSKTTQQDMFDRVYRHLTTQLEKSLLVGDDGVCAYRSHNGLRCAVGCLIADEHYSEHLEGGSADDPEVALAVGLSLGLGRDLDSDEALLALDLQVIHDTRSPSEWHEALRRLARARGLRIPQS